jgi:predicted GIY-YIG superfamily endonuclease
MSVDEVRLIKIIPYMWHVYILKCCDGTYYTGCTNDLTDRFKRHNRGEISYTSTRLPFELVTYIVFTNKYKAYDFEKYLKSGSGKAFAFKRLV